MSKRVILSDSSINSYGYRVLTSGGRLDRFKKNPIMLYMHMRDEGSPRWCNYKAIGYWKDIQIEDDVLSAVPVFDKVDELSKEIAAKFEAGTFRAASIGIRVLGTSEDANVLLPGQTRASVVDWELLEASIVDIPSNGNAVRLYDSSSVVLAAGMETDVVPEIKMKEKTMNLKASWKTVLAFLGVKEEQAEQTTLSAENIEKLDTEMARLKSENERLSNEKSTLEASLSAKETELATLNGEGSSKDAEIAKLKGEASSKDEQIKQLNEQVANLKAAPAPQQEQPAPKSEPVSEEKEDLAAFCEKTDSKDYAAYVERLKKDGFI